MLLERMQALLQRRKQQQAFRTFRNLDYLIDFSSNDYLGLARNPTLQAQVHEASQSLALGATGSRLLSGHYDLLDQLELVLTEVHQAEAALVFNSGYNANLGLLSAIARKGDLLLYDELVHASIHDGMKLSKATTCAFGHNDMAALEELLQKNPNKNILVLVEAIYSMDGDAAPLSEIAMLCEQYQAHLVVDEAHSTGVFGAKGGGLCVQLGIADKVFARVHTFGKAMGSHGAAILGSQLLKDYLVNYARPFIYTTAISPHSVLTTLLSYQYLAEQEAVLLPALQQKIERFKKSLTPQVSTKVIESNSAIQCLQVAGNSKVVAIAEQLQKLGFDVRPIRSPTVAAGAERLRICLHHHNSTVEIETLGAELCRLLADLG